MATKARKNKFETEVHFGLLVIMLILVGLNFAGNYTSYRARQMQREVRIQTLNRAAVIAAREIRGKAYRPFTAEEQRFLREEYNLSSIALIPSAPPSANRADRRAWFVSIADRLPLERIGELAGKLILADYLTLSRGKGDEYFYVHPLPAADGNEQLLVISAIDEELAFLDDTGRIILIAGLAAMLIVAGVYWWMSRFMFNPFRRIRQQAVEAGREVEGNDDVEAMVEDYRAIISELQQKEAQLTALNKITRRRADSAESFNRYLLKSIDSGIVTVGTDGRIIAVNDAAIRITSLPEDDYTGLSFRDLPAIGLLLESDLLSVMRRRVDRVKYHERIIHDASGQEMTIGLSVSPIRDSVGEIIGASLLLNDLTELRRLRHEIEQQRQLAALGEMSAGLAHQLRNSLGAIIGFSGLAQKRMKSGKPSGSSLVSLTEEANEAERLIDRFLGFTRPFDLSLAETNVCEFVNEVVNSVRMNDDFSDIDIKVQLEPNLTAPVDRLLLKQALINIIDNAANAYQGRRGKVEISALAMHDNIALEVRDFGCGIDPEQQARIFTPFFSTRPSGTGLGLPLAARIVNLHSGNIEVESEPGRGTIFRLVLPSASAEPSHAAQARTPEVVPVR